MSSLLLRFSPATRRLLGQYLVGLARYTSTIVRTPPKSAPRECPTPLVFVSAKDWDPSSAGMELLLSALPEKGYTCLDIRLSPPEGPIKESQQLMHHFESSLRKEIRLSAISFPPIIFAKSTGCLISQTFISSWPATGLVMLSPPSDNSVVLKGLLPTPLPEFNYEPKFPMSIIATLQESTTLQAKHRLLQDESVDLFEVDDVEGAHALNEVERWLDDLGI